MQRPRLEDSRDSRLRKRAFAWVVVAGALSLSLIFILIGTPGSNADAPTPSAGAPDATLKELDRIDPERVVHEQAVTRPLPATTAAASQHAQRATSAPPWLPLPPLGTPVREILEELEQRSKAGDAAAACRLSAEVAQCVSVQGFDPARTERMLIEAAARNPDGPDVERWTEQIDRRLRMQKRCAGLPQHVLDGQARYDLTAARLGSATAAQRFLGGWSLNTAALIREPGLAALYRHHAWPLFQQLLQAGHPAAPLLWMQATQRPNFPLAEVMPAEWQRPAVAEALFALISGSVSGRYKHGPPPSAEAQAEAARLFQAYFVASPHYSGGAPPPPALQGDPASCDDLVPVLPE